MKMHISDKGLSIIKHFEQLVLRTYKDAVGVLTIGYGHTGKDVHEGLVITEQRANELLLQDVARFELAVNSTIKQPLTQNQFDALVSLAYNIGDNGFMRSTLAKTINANPNNEAGVRAGFAMYNKAKGKVLAGLTWRRGKEADLYFTK